MTDTSSSRPCRRPRQDRRRVWFASAIAVAGLASDSTAFAPISTQRRPTTQRFYQVAEAPDITSTIVSQAILSQPTVTPDDAHMPTWLRVPREHRLEDNLNNLKMAMANSFMSEVQAQQIIHAIEEASGGDKKTISGAAEFLLILVETMEMGANALAAAAFHYCTCVSALEFKKNYPTESFWDTHEHPQGIHTYFGDHVLSIAEDAARLKKIETVAASVMQRTSRVSPDTLDAENLRNLLLTETRDWRSLAIRSAACLYRLRGILSSGDEQRNPTDFQVAREALRIYAPLASRLGMHRLKNELEGAAFKILYRRQYRTVTSLALQSRRLTDDDASVQHIEQSMKEILSGVEGQLQEILAHDDVFSKYAENVVVTGRVKESYSLWQKMLRNGAKHILEIPDALALRIVFDGKKFSDEDIKVTRARERALCYYAQKLCMERWKPAEDPRIKDYVDMPKTNGYQSLHYTASTNWGGEDWSLEIQVRTGEMHKVAEYGFASHWDYKANSKNHHGGEDLDVSKGSSHKAYLKSLQEWHWQQQSGVTLHSGATPASFDELLVDDEVQSNIRTDKIRARTARLAPYIEAFAEAQSDLEREHVFVFLAGDHTKEGKVMALPAGACVLDALRDAEKKLGFKVNWREEKGIVYNGMAVEVTQKLSNGDVLTLPNTAKVYM